MGGAASAPRHTQDGRQACPLMPCAGHNPAPAPPSPSASLDPTIPQPWAHQRIPAPHQAAADGAPPVQDGLLGQQRALAGKEERLAHSVHARAGALLQADHGAEQEGRLHGHLGPARRRTAGEGGKGAGGAQHHAGAPEPELALQPARGAVCQREAAELDVLGGQDRAKHALGRHGCKAVFDVRGGQG